MSRAGFLLAVVSAASTMVIAQNPLYRQDSSWRAPSTAVGKRNPLAATPELTAGGRKLFLKNCAECHGSDGKGMEKKHSADLRLPDVQAQTDGILFWKITNGNTSRGMPPFSKLPEPQRWQLVLYMKTLNGN